MESNMIGEKIAQARKRTNLSQAQLAEQLFISPQAVGKWERGESIPDIVTISKLARILGIDLNYFSESAPTQEDGSVQRTKHENKQGDQQTEEEDASSASQERPLLTNFSGSALADTDFAGVSAPKRKFTGSDLRGADFSKADLTGSYFMGSDMKKANLDGTNLTDCSFSAVDLGEAHFDGTILVRTSFVSTDLTQTKFSNVRMVDVKLTTTDLTKTLFEHCSFHGVDFKSSDLSGVCLDGQTFNSVKFDNAALSGASFKGATFKNVSFRPTFALTNRYYKTLKTIDLEGAMMDKLTYAALKGIGVDMSKVMII